ncbi:MAG: Rieske (2Fe-2S) protein [Actinobacteria bacterium]|nr:Rieske (2Fe-2S) protein [Actinomycetota bacterium]
MSAPDRERRAVNQVAVAFGVSALASLGLAAVYWQGGQNQVEGVLLAIALGGLGYGFVVVARRLLPQGPYTEERDVLPSSEGQVAAFETDLERGEGWLARRGFLLKMLGVAAGALGVAALFPLRSLGPNPGNSLRRTKWRRGSLVVDEQGEPVRVRTLEVGGVLTVFPEGHLEREDSQTLLIRISDENVVTRKGREDWAPEGYVAYSKVCTHAGCPVGLYQQDVKRLLCPCHQSSFDAVEGARPMFGPATRSLPQLPLMVDDNGLLRAQDDYDEPIGPGFWDRGR